jgi:hypothetical protein
MGNKKILTEITDYTLPITHHGISDIIELAMINFKIITSDNNFLTLEKPTGKSIAFQIGDTIRAKVMDILPTGEVTLKIKGDFITAKTEVPIEKGAEAFLKVTGQSTDGKELRLQFSGYANAAESQNAALKTETLGKMIQELANVLADNKGADAAKIQNLNADILKTLPQDVNSLPKDIRVQLQNLLLSALKETGQSLQSRVDSLLNILPENLKNSPAAESIQKDLMINIEKLLQTPMKTALQDTGIALEAKLKAITYMFQLPEIQDSAKPADNNESALLKGLLSLGSKAEDTEEKQAGLTKKAEVFATKTETLAEKPVLLKNDLKAGLLQLKELLSANTANEADKTTKAAAVETKAQNPELLAKVDGLLKDIETFQLLSKTTDSFYTFLPLEWKGLKDGDVSFKRGKAGAKGVPYSCRINLDLEELGKLSAMVVLYNNEFFVTFKSEDPAFQSVIEANSKELQESFSSRGMRLKGVNVLAINDDSFEQLEKLQSSDKIVSIRA